MDLANLEEKLKATQGKRFRVIATDGVFSMDGDIARLKEICDLAEKYAALVMVDDAHATGVLGKDGGGSPEACGVQGRIDFLTGTFGKALGGAGGAFTATNRVTADYLRQRSRTYLFSNALDTAVVGTALYTLGYLREHPEIREKLWSNVRAFREGMKSQGFKVKDVEHPITPIMLGDERKTLDMAKALFDEGIYAVGFVFPVVPKGTARIRVQVSAAHTPEDIALAVEKFAKVGKQFSIISPLLTVRLSKARGSSG